MPAAAAQRLDRPLASIACSPGPVAMRLAAMGVLSFFLISPMLLFHWGVSYEASGGNVLEKMHPGTFLVFAALAIAMLRQGRPVAYLIGRFEALPGTIVFALAWLWLLAHIILVQKAPFTPIIDTFAMPIALLFLLDEIDEPMRRRLARLLHMALFLNALLGFMEFRTGWRLTPYVAGDLLIEDDWRATALLGHPLANAIVAGAYALILAVGGGRDMPAWMRPLALLAQLAGMIAFGGRAGLVLCFLFLALIVLVHVFDVLRGARVHLLSLGTICLALPVLAIAMAGLWESGFFDQLFTRFSDDKGSAKARLIMLQFFHVLDWTSLMLGADPGYLQSLQRLEGIEYGIESFFIAFILSYGLVVSLAFFIGLAFFLREILRISRAAAIVPLLFFFLVSSTSVSLSAKTVTLGMLLALITVLLPREGSLAPMRHRRV